MRRLTLNTLFLLLALLCGATCSYAAISVNHAQTFGPTSTGGSPNSYTFAPTSTTGNLIVCIISTNGNGTGVVFSSMTDNGSGGANTYTDVGSTATLTSQGTTYIKYAKAAHTAVTSVTITTTGASAGNTIGIGWYDLSGADTSAPFGVAGALSNQTASTTPSGPNVNATTTGGIIVSGLRGSVFPNTVNTTGSFTFVGEPASTQDGFAYLLNSSTGSQGPSWTQSSSATWMGLTASFKAPTAAATRPPAVF